MYKKTLMLLTSVILPFIVIGCSNSSSLNESNTPVSSGSDEDSSVDITKFKV